LIEECKIKLVDFEGIKNKNKNAPIKRPSIEAMEGLFDKGILVHKNKQERKNKNEKFVEESKKDSIIRVWNNMRDLIIKKYNIVLKNRDPEDYKYLQLDLKSNNKDEEKDDIKEKGVFDENEVEKFKNLSSMITSMSETGKRKIDDDDGGDDEKSFIPFDEEEFEMKIRACVNRVLSEEVEKSIGKAFSRAFEKYKTDVMEFHNKYSFSPTVPLTSNISSVVG
jgi:hypothetical protein